MLRTSTQTLLSNLDKIFMDFFSKTKSANQFCASSKLYRGHRRKLLINIFRLA